MQSSGNALFRSVVVGIALLGLATVAGAQQKFVNILTGGQSGVYYPLGVALSQIYNKAMPDVKTSVQATKASVENLNLLDGESFLSLFPGTRENRLLRAGFPLLRSNLVCLSRETGK